jgi:ABC-2 type transport system permease protein
MPGIALVIAAKDLRLRLRDRTALLTAFVAPIVIALIMSAALGGFDHGVHAHVAVVDADRGPVARAFFAALEAPALRPTLSVSRSTADAARSALRRRSVGAIITIPAGFSDQAQPSPPTLSVTGRDDQPIGRAVARAVADAFMSRVSAVRLAVQTATSVPTGAATTPVTDVAGSAAASVAKTVADRSPGRRVPPGTYFAPAMGVLFLFFTASFGARSFLVERREQTLQRTLAAPVPPGLVVAGKAIATFVLGVSSLLVLWVVTTFVFHYHWGDPVAIATLSVAIAGALVAVTAVITTFARTDEQAAGYTNVVVFALALVGGNFIALYQLPRSLRMASALTPNGWALRGFADLAAGSGHVGAIVRPLLAVTGFAAVFGFIALRRASRLVGP